MHWFHSSYLRETWMSLLLNCSFFNHLLHHRLTATQGATVVIAHGWSDAHAMSDGDVCRKATWHEKQQDEKHVLTHCFHMFTTSSRKSTNCQTKKLNCLFTCYIFSGFFFIYIIVYTKDWAVDLSPSCIHTLSCSAFHRAQCSNRHPIIWTGCGRHYRERDLIYISVSLRDCNAQQHVNTHNTFPTIWPWRHCARCCVMRGFTLVSSAHWLRDVSKEIFNPQHPVL